MADCFTNISTADIEYVGLSREADMRGRLVSGLVDNWSEWYSGYFALLNTEYFLKSLSSRIRNANYMVSFLICAIVQFIFELIVNRSKSGTDLCSFANGVFPCE